jgi:NADPH:quinone reductase-like Zn-dependent oxidoreductase
LGFLFLRAQGQQLSEITSLIESGIIRPFVDKMFPFGKTREALAYVETGHAKGKVVITVTFITTASNKLIYIRNRGRG